MFHDIKCNYKRINHTCCSLMTYNCVRPHHKQHIVVPIIQYIKKTNQTPSNMQTVTFCCLTHLIRCSSLCLSSASLFRTDRIISCSSSIRKLKSIMMIEGKDFWSQRQPPALVLCVSRDCSGDQPSDTVDDQVSSSWGYKQTQQHHWN